MSERSELDKAFREVSRTVSLSDGFTLLPIEMTGPDVARGLGEWLAREGYAVSVIEPLDDDAWQRLVADLFDVKPDPRGVVLVVGTREPAQGVYAGLRLLNQRRDSVARHIACPMLWCGPPEFLKLTWERAPDFWSVRALPVHIDVPARQPSEPPIWGGAWVADPPERLRALVFAAKKQGDLRNAGRGGLALAEALVARSELDDADEALDDAEAALGETSAAWITRATIAALRGDLARAEAALARPSSDPQLEGRRLLGVGNLALMRAPRDTAAAVAAFERAAELLRAAGDPSNEAVALANIAVARLADDPDAAEEGLARAASMLREVGDERNEALAVMKLGSVHLAQRDSRQACERFEEALALFRALGDRRGEAEVLRRLARAYLELGDPEKALYDSARAIALADDLGDAAGKEEAAALSTRAREELGEKR